MLCSSRFVDHPLSKTHMRAIGNHPGEKHRNQDILQLERDKNGLYKDGGELRRHEEGSVSVFIQIFN